jgi:hypothetical protein
LPALSPSAGIEMHERPRLESAGVKKRSRTYCCNADDASTDVRFGVQFAVHIGVPFGSS